MIQLPPNLQSQIGEAVSVIADSDFPERWEDLVTVSITHLSYRVLTANKFRLLFHAYQTQIFLQTMVF